MSPSAHLSSPRRRNDAVAEFGEGSTKPAAWWFARFDKPPAPRAPHRYRAVVSGPRARKCRRSFECVVLPAVRCAVFGVGPYRAAKDALA